MATPRKYNFNRVSKYTPEILEKTQEYINTFHMDNLVPTERGLALHLGVSHQTVRDWKIDQSKEEFGFLLDMMMSIQHDEIINKGLAGDFNATIAKLMLHNHGYSDRQDVTSDNKPISIAPEIIRLVGPDE